MGQKNRENTQIFSSACFGWCSVNILAKEVHRNIGIRGSNGKKQNRDERVNIPAKEVLFFFFFLNFSFSGYRQLGSLNISSYSALSNTI